MHLPIWLIQIAVFIGQLIIMVGVAYIVATLQRSKTINKFLRINPLDLWPFLSLIFIVQITAGRSPILSTPLVIAVWIAIEAILLVWRMFTDRYLTYKSFLIMFWRSSDLILFVSWIIVSIGVLFTN